MVHPRVVLSESKIRTRKTPICLSPEPLAICVQIFDLLSDRKGGGNPPPFPSAGRNRHVNIVRIADTLSTL